MNFLTRTISSARIILLLTVGPLKLQAQHQTSFNRTNVSAFFDNLTTAIKKSKDWTC